MLREIITPQTQDYTVKIPLEYLNTKVEILVLPLDEPEIKSIPSRKKYTKQEMLKCLAYQGTSADSQNLDGLIYP
ncbi:MAG: hypothetical protein R3E08_13055 [Thiotrichaceae bacterium]